MGLDEELCPHCRRPRDEREIEQGKLDLVEAEAKRKGYPRLVALRLAAVAGLMALFFARHLLSNGLESLTHRGSAELDRYTDPDFVAGRSPNAGVPVAETSTPILDAAAAATGEPPASARLVFSAPPATTPAPSTQTVIAAPAAPPAPPSAKAPPPVAAAPRKARTAPPPPAPSSTNWLFYGVVYDMATGLAIPHAKVVIHHPNEDTGLNAATDANGFYRLYIPRGIGGNDYLIEATARGYRQGQAEDREPYWRDAADAVRLSAMNELTGHDLDAIPRKPENEDGLVEVDMALLPQPAKKAAP
jgi:hypothetical protein